MASQHSRLELQVPDELAAEHAMAEAWAAGALGIEERSHDAGVLLLIYFASESEPELREALSPFVDAGARAIHAESVEEVDWSERWKDGLEAIVVSPRLVVRPSFIEFALGAGQAELVIDPGQAFGTGGHASTLLALEWIDQLSPTWSDSPTPHRVLDIGTGTGVLAMAALRLGAQVAVGLDLDPVAIREAARLARLNRLGPGLALFTGTIAALHAPPFDCVLANMLRSEMLPMASEIAAAVRPGGRLVLSGLLDTDRDAVLSAFGAVGLVPADERSRVDETGDRWIAPMLERPTSGTSG
jgi:ribosomal protein L11 methyltransferase